MKEAIRCFISCIFPCGALDVIRIVHADGRVEEISHAVLAGEITQAYPKHVLRKPPSPASIDDDSTAPVARRAVVLPPTAELQRGKIYFLVPVSEKAAAKESRRRDGGEERRKVEMAKEKERVSTSTQRDRRRGRVGVWRPRLDSISEMMSQDL